MENPNLSSWNALNEFIVAADEKACKALLREELKGKNRKMFVLRIHSRLNRVRADNERAQLLKLGAKACVLKWVN